MICTYSAVSELFSTKSRNGTFSITMVIFQEKNYRYFLTNVNNYR